MQRGRNPKSEIRNPKSVMSSESDRLLIQSIRTGDKQAWEQLISRYEGRLLAFARQRLHDRSLCEDVVQETFVGFLTSLPNFDEQRELQTYLFTIASYKITDQLRRSSRRPHSAGGEGGDELLGQQLDERQLTASSAARGAEQRELERTAIARAIGQLIHKWKTDGDYERLKVMELLLVRGWPNRDVAKFLRISEQQVANIRFAAMKKVAEHVRHAGLPVEVFPELYEIEKQ
jgi:RNA polymerase sigma-70 factor (ECF subfamily)